MMQLSDTLNKRQEIKKTFTLIKFLMMKFRKKSLPFPFSGIFTQEGLQKHGLQYIIFANVGK